MRKLLLVALLLASASGAALAQEPNNSGQNEIPNMGRAPREVDGVGRLDLRVVDQNGNPVQGVRADFKSYRTNGMLCEAWNWTDARGVSVIPPLHIGNRLELVIKAKGYETLKLNLSPGQLGEPVRVTLVSKK